MGFCGLGLPFLNNSHAMDKYRHGERPFAFVTGSSAGIGYALAFELAALQFNVIIHARTIEELTPVKEAIIAKYPDIKVVCIAQDAAARLDWPQFTEQLKGLRITVLINNVAMSLPVPYNALETASEDAIEQTIRANTIFPSQLTRNVLPTLVENSPSIILNICSASIYVPPPFLLFYTSTKSFNLTWSKALHNELLLLRRDVACKAVMTGSVQSDGNNIPTGAFVPSSQDFACSLLARANSSGPVYYGYWRHGLQIVPGRLIVALFPSIMGTIAQSVSRDLLRWRESIGDETALKLDKLPPERRAANDFALMSLWIVVFLVFGVVVSGALEVSSIREIYKHVLYSTRILG